MTKGLYFYKLVSPYEEDVTKDCKLTINEIDSNFLNLKNLDINNVHVDEEEKKAVLTRENGEDLVLDLKKVTEHTLDVDYNSVDGVIEVTYDGETYAIKGLVTKDNLSKEILTKVYSDCTLEGIGTSASPLSIASVQRTGQFKAAIKVIDTTINERLPNHGIAKGDRYVTLEEISDFGLLYNFESVKRINDLLRKTGWRVATKSDWDSMLNAIEPCEYRDHASTLNNRVLGHLAGSLLKATHDWRTAGMIDDHHEHKHDKHEAFDPYEVEEEVEKMQVHPDKKPQSHGGKDSYGMGILPGGYAYYSRPMQYNQFGFQGAYWTSDMLYDTDVYTKVFEANESGVLQVGERPSAFLSIRLVKDYDGTNDKGVENILGDNYKTVLMPSLGNPNGYAVWTAQNFRLREAHLESAIPNAGLGVHREKVYFINEWNGFGWDKIQMEEGDAITILNSKNWNESYRVIEGKLTNVTSYIASNIRHEVHTDLNALRDRIHEAEHAINDNKHHIEGIKKKISEIDVVNAVQDDRIQRSEDDIEAIKWKHQKDTEFIHKRIDDLKKETNDKFDEVDSRNTEIEENLESEIDRAKKAEEELNTKIESETERAEEAEKALDEKIETETERAEEAEKALDEKIESETERATKEEERLQNAIDDEQARAELAEEELNNKIDAEIDRATARENEIEDNLNAEIERATDRENEIENNLNEEIERAKTAEQELSDRATDLEAHRLKSETVEGGSHYDDKEGKLTLEAENPEYNIEVTFSFDFGTLKSKED